jgi:hypothetical protein
MDKRVSNWQTMPAFCGNYSMRVANYFFQILCC